MADAAEPPTPARRLQTVVLRPGPPAPRKARWDAVTGVAGAVLILAAVAMVWLLPEEDVINPQFQVDVEQVQVPVPSVQLDMRQGESMEVPFEVAQDNVFYIRLDVAFRDDLPSSRPDTFEVAVFDEEGNLVGDRAILTNEPGRPRNNTANLEWEAILRKAILSFDIALPPEPTFVTGETPAATEEEVAQAFSEQFHVETTGTWTVRVTMREAGGCPEPGPTQDPRQIAACRATAGDAGDPGNRFTIEQFQYTYFEPRVSRL